MTERDQPDDEVEVQVAVPPDRGRRRRVGWVIGSTVAVLLIAAAAFAYWSPSPSSGRHSLAPQSSDAPTSAEATLAADTTVVDTAVADTAVAVDVTVDVTIGVTVDTTLVTTAHAAPHPKPHPPAPPGSLMAVCLDRFNAQTVVTWPGCNLQAAQCAALFQGPAVLTLPNMVGLSFNEAVATITPDIELFPFCTNGRIPVFSIIPNVDQCTTDPAMINRVYVQNIAAGTPYGVNDMRLVLSLDQECPTGSYVPPSITYPPLPPPPPPTTTIAPPPGT